MFNVVGCDLECPECGVYGPHRFDGEETACLACGTPREVEPELIAAVLDMRFCDWCQDTLPSGHACGAVEPACMSRTQLVRCGACPACLAVVARAQSGSPVQDLADCRWCNAMKPVGHDCPAGAVGCTTNPPEGPACGACSGCTGTQSVDLARRAESEHGSPPDLDSPRLAKEER